MFSLATIDLSAVTDGIADLQGALLLALGGVVALGLAIYAIPFGVRVCKKVFNAGSK